MQRVNSTDPRLRLWSALATGVMGSLVAICTLTVVLHLEGASYKAWVVALGMALLPATLAVVGHPKEILLFGWVFALTYNRQYFIFEPVVGYNGTQGPYVILADICFAGLFGWWLYERLMRRPAEPPQAPPFWPWYVPFAAACLLSAFGASRPDWSIYELIRIAKIGLILYYVRYNFGRREWHTTFAALGSAVFFQSAVAIKEVITGKPGVIGASQMANAPEFVQQFQDGGFTGNIVRGVGTLAHPPYLACYLLLVLPVLLALALTAQRRRAALYAGAFLVGCGGLAATLSRWPWLVAIVEFSLVIIALVLLRQMAVKHALGLAAVGSFVLLMSLLPIRDKLMNRLTGDLVESMRYRSEGTRASLQAIEDHPLLGFGLNNTAIHLGEYLPEMEWGLVTEEFASRTLHLRAPIALGNGFLHVAEQTGILGLIGFLLFVLGGLFSGLRSAAATSGEQRAVCIGMLVGILGCLAEQVADTPLWVDPVLYTFTLYFALLSIAAPLFGSPKATVPSRLYASV
jgi:putative inorganic carbon (HCO3(-)) transporter